MNIMTPVVIRGTGAFVPEQTVTNEHFTEYLDTTDEWIVQRTGIKTRHKVSEGESTVTIAAEACRRAVDDAGCEISDIDLLILCTATPEMPIPSTSCILQNELGMTGGAAAFDVSAACSGFVYGMIIAGQMLATGLFKNALVCGAEVLTSVTDYEDRSTCILFGDGAGAVVMSKSPDPERGFLYNDLGADGSKWDYIWMPGGGTREPISQKVVDERLHYMRMRGRDVYKIAVTKMQSMVDNALEACNLTPDDLSMAIMHQSNLRIIESVRTRLKLPPEKVAVNINKYGNTSAASIGLALDAARKDGRVKVGDIVLMMAFGAGVTWGTIVARM